MQDGIITLQVHFVNSYKIEHTHHQFSSVTQFCLTLCDPLDCSMPKFPIHHQLLELAQTHVHWVSDAIQPSHHLSSLSSFPVWNHSVVPCPILNVAFWPACRFLRRQVRWPGNPISWRIFHSLLWSTLSKTLAKSKINIFLELLFYLDVGNLVTGSSTFSKSSLNIWKFTVHILLKAG